MQESFGLSHFNRDGETVRAYKMTKREFEALKRVLLRLRPSAPITRNPLPRKNERIPASVFKNMEGHRQIDMAAFAYCLNVARIIYQSFPELVVSETQTRGYAEALRFWHEVVRHDFDDPDPLVMARETVLQTDYEQRLRAISEKDASDDQQMLAWHRENGG